MIGVDDNCKVYGISCNRKQEDLARCQLDNTIKGFQPHIMPNLYVVDFIPVKLTLDDKIQLDSVDPLLKVVEVSVNKPTVINALYENDKGEVFIRRDGSVEGPLRTTQIVDWCRANFTRNNADTNKDIVSATESNNNNLSSSNVHENNVCSKICNNIPQFDRLEGVMNKTNARIEEQLQRLQATFIDRERILQSELLKAKIDLANATFQLEHMRRRPSSFSLCNIL